MLILSPSNLLFLIPRHCLIWGKGSIYVALTLGDFSAGNLQGGLQSGAHPSVSGEFLVLVVATPGCYRVLSAVVCHSGRGCFV